jgi:hypothetical protein
LFVPVTVAEIHKGRKENEVKIGWVVDSEDLNNSCFLARVFRPHQQLLAWGINSRIFGPGEPVHRWRGCDVLIFHRTVAQLDQLAGTDMLLGFDLADDLLRYAYAALPVDFILTDSLPNTRFYLSRNTHYWPHGFPDQTAGHASGPDTETRFVFCGAPENVHCLVGAPLEALETVGASKPISLRIITNLKMNKESWLAQLPKIESRSFRVEWLQFDQATHEALIKECHVGFFPQSMDKDRWRKKSIFKPTHAASLGLPSISSPTEEALMNFLHNQTALLPNSAGEWVKAVETMTLPAEQARIRENAIRLYQLRFTVEMATQQLLGTVRIQAARAKGRKFGGIRRFMLRCYVNAERALDAIEKRMRRLDK